MTREFDLRIPVASTALAVALTAYSTLKSPRSSDSARETAIELVIVAIVATATFLLTRRAISGSASAPSGRAALVLAVVGLVSVLAFFLGIFGVALAGAAIMIALDARERRAAPTAATAALVIAGLAVLLSVLIAIVS